MTLIVFVDYLSLVFPTGVLRDSCWLWNWLHLSSIICPVCFSLVCCGTVVGYDIGCIYPRLSVPCVSHWCAAGQWLVMTLVAFTLDYLSLVFLTGVLRDSGWLWNWLHLSIICPVCFSLVCCGTVVVYDICCICRLSVPCVSHWCAAGQWLFMELVAFVDYLSLVFLTGVLRDSGWL